MTVKKDELKNYSLVQFVRKIDEVQNRISHLSEKGKKDSAAPDQLSGQLFEELNVLMEELHVAAEELHQQSEELVEAQSEVEKERLRYQDLFDFAPDGYFVTDQFGMIVEANQAAGTMLNISPQHLIPKPLAQYVAMEHRRDFRGQLNHLGDLSNGSINRIENWEFRMIPRSGESIDVSATVTAILPDHNFSGETHLFRWLIRDITDQKRFQEEVKEIKNELLKSRERSRQQLARSLHDGPLQDLHGVIFQLKPVETEIDQPVLKDNLSNIETQLIEIIRKLRMICTDLRPPTLGPFGLEKAIRSHAETYLEKHPDIQIDLELEPDTGFLTEEVRLVFFQIYLQAVTNTIRHSEADKLWVHLKVNEGNICLEVGDNGKGFDVPEDWIEMVRNHHLGLADAMERAESIGSRLEVNSKPGRGTKVRVCLPQEDQDSERTDEG